MNLSRFDDTELVELYKKNPDTSLIEELYNRYSKRVYWWALKFLGNRLEAEEMVHDIFAAMMSGMLDLYQAREGAKFSSWLYRCVGNQCMKIVRKRNEVIFNQVEVVDVPEALIIDLEVEVIAKEWNEQLTSALNRLNQMQRVCCMRFYWDGMRYDEIAEELGITHDQVRSHLQNGLRNLRIIFGRSQGSTRPQKQ